MTCSLNPRRSHRRVAGAAGALIVAALVMVSPAPALAQEAAADDPLAATRPGPEQEALAGLAGEWDVSLTFGGRTVEGPGTVTTVIGARFIDIHYAVGAEDESVEGRFTVGFDRRNQRYQLVALDTYGTYFVTSEGAMDPETGRIKLTGTDEDPHMAAMGFTKEYAHVFGFAGDDAFTIEVYFIDTRTEARNEILAMTYAFTRRK